MESEVLSAIVIVGSERRVEPDFTGRKSLSGLGRSAVETPAQPLVCVDVLGRSVLYRLIDDLHRSGIETISVLADTQTAPAFAGLTSHGNAVLRSVEDPWQAAQHLAAESFAPSAAGRAVLLIQANAYVECDLADMLQFHREQENTITRSYDREGPLDIWVVDGEYIKATNSLSGLQTADAARYEVGGYVKRLDDARDLRRLAVDGLTFRCHLRPRGAETRPGVWIDESAQVNKDARVVAPAYIGRGSRIEAQCLITRCSAVESNCQVDYGTVVEDSSILTNTYVGIGLDLSHSIVDGNNLLNLERGVTLEIADPCVIRQNRNTRRDRNRRAQVVVGLGGGQFAQAEERSR